jgi:hypothetical protein
VSGFSLHDTVTVDTNWGHETERSETLGDNVWLHITIVVFAGPHEATLALNSLGNEIINETVLVIKICGLKLATEVFFIFILESVNEKTVVLLENSVLGRQHEGEVAVKSVGEAGFSKGSNGVVSVEHSEVAAGAGLALELVNELSLLVWAVSRRVDQFDFTRFGGDAILATVLVTESVSANNDGLSPARDESWDVFNDNRFTEDGTVENVSNSSVRGPPHLLQFELLNTTLIRGNGGALNADLGALHGIGAVNGDLVVGSVTVLDGEIVVLEIDIDVGQNVLELRVRLCGLITFSLIHYQMTFVISSPSTSTTELATLTFLKEAKDLLEIWFNIFNYK